MINKENILAFLLGTVLIFYLTGRYISVQYEVDIFRAVTGADALSPFERSWLDKHGSIIYGADQNSPPLRFVDGDNRQYKGIVVDYILALSIELETEIVFKPRVWSQALTELAEGKTDVCDMLPSVKRGEKYLFSEPVYNMRGLVLLPNGHEAPTRPEELRQRLIAAPGSDFVIDHLKNRVPSIRFVYTSDMLEAMKLLKQGEVDGVAGDEPVISFFLETLGMKGTHHFMDPPLYEMENVLAVPKSEEILLNILNKGIRSLKRKETMAKIQQKWFGISTPLIRENIKEKLLIVSLIFLCMILLTVYLFSSWNKLLKKEVERRTRQLFESRKQLQTTFDSLTYFMIVIDGNMGIVNANRAFCRYLGIPPKDVIQDRKAGQCSLLTDAVTTRMIRSAFNGNPPERGEFTVRHTPYMVRTFPLSDEKRRIPNVLCMIKDISQEKENEKRLLHANKMTAVGRLAAGVTHEIRNPLGLIRNHCFLLKKALKQGDPTNLRAVSVIENAVLRSNRIIDNLLNFSRMSGNRLEKVDMGRMLHRMVDLQRKTLSEKRITIEVTCPEGLEGDINQEAFGLVVVNLLSNAVDATECGGKCEIIAKRKGEMLNLRFRDNGKGIPKEIMDKIFEPFFTTKSRGVGTGLGLYIAYDQVQKCGGWISARSRATRGAEFEVEVPFREGGERLSHGKE